MLEAILNTAGLLLGPGCTIIWIIALVKWDGKRCEPGEDCEACPFPCEEHQKNNHTEV